MSRHVHPFHAGCQQMIVVACRGLLIELGHLVMWHVGLLERPGHVGQDRERIAVVPDQPDFDRGVLRPFPDGGRRSRFVLRHGRQSELPSHDLLLLIEASIAAINERGRSPGTTLVMLKMMSPKLRCSSANASASRLVPRICSQAGSVSPYTTR